MENQSKQAAPAVKEWKSSTQVETTSYDAATKELTVKFRRSPELYVYKGVPADTHQELLFCDSIGKFLNANIKPNYEFEKVAQDEN